MAFDRDFTLAHIWKVEIEGLQIGEFQSVTFPNAEVKVVEYSTGGTKSPRKRPGTVTWSNLVLKRGYAKDRTLQKWWHHIVSGVQDRRSVSVVQCDEEGKETMRWNFFNCWPCKWQHTEMAGNKAEINVETLELCVESAELAG